MKLENVIATKGRGVYTLPPDASIAQAIAMLAENNIGAVIAIDPGNMPVGILSERDLIRATARGPVDLERPIRDLMTHDVVTGSPGDDVDTVLRTMTERHFRHLPVVADGGLVGMVSLGDLVKAQLQAYRGAVENLETQLLEA